MSKSKSKSKSTSREAKRARFTGEKKSSGASPLVLIAGLVVVVIIIGIAAFALTRPSPTVAESLTNPLLSSDECTDGAECGPTAAELQASTSSSGLKTYPVGSQGLTVSAATHGHQPYPQVVAEDGVVRLTLSTFDDYKAHHYTYMHGGQPIEFFVLKSKDGVVRAAFNACDVCYDSKKGYTQDGDVMICNNCGRRFPADQINVVHGGCNPSPLGRVVDGDTLVIEVEDIIAGKSYF
jgi:hypothetical protein